MNNKVFNKGDVTVTNAGAKGEETGVERCKNSRPLRYKEDRIYLDRNWFLLELRMLCEV